MKTQLKTLLLLALTLGAAFLYSRHPVEIVLNIKLAKPHFNQLSKSSSFHSPQEKTSQPHQPDASEITGQANHPVDTTHQNILFFGDSMLEGLCRRFIDYTEENDHELHTVVWYSSTTKIWAETDTLQHFIRKFSPTFVVICLGGNELSVNDLHRRDGYIKAIVRKLGHLPFVWIGPPNWKEDTGINNLIINNVGKERYFESRHLELERGSDHAHPTYKASSVWMDSIAVWLNSQQTAHPLRMNYPRKHVKSHHVTVLMPLK